MPNYKHYCREWDLLEIDADSPEFEACLCDIDSDGKPPAFYPGDRVYCKPARMKATVIRQIKHYDGEESFWGDLELCFDDDIKGIANCWQCEVSND